MPTTVGHRTRQLPTQIVDIATWRRDEDYPIFPVGSKPKRLVKCPSAPIEPFLLADHRYLYKTAQDWRSQQTWSEVIAYELARDLPLPIPPAFIAIDSSEGSVGVLIEFFYGYPDDPTPPHFLHGTDLLQRIRRGRSYDPRIDRPHSVQLNIRMSSTLGAQSPHEWWAKTITFDALIGNTDRHPQNWGFLVSRIRPEQVDLELAPVFDNGTSLGYQFPEERLTEPWAPDRLAAFIRRGHHHCSWRPDSPTGDSHLELCRSLYAHDKDAGAVARNVIRLADSNIEELMAWCEEFSAPLRFSSDRARFVAQQLKARRDALAKAAGT